MFFQKKNPIPEENVAKQSIKKMDRVVTGVLLGGIIASIYGVNKLRHKEDKVPPQIHEETEQKNEKKQSILSRIFF